MPNNTKKENKVIKKYIENIDKATVDKSSNLKWWEMLIPGYNQYRLIQDLGARVAPFTQMVSDVVDNNVFRPLREMLGITPPNITERSFTKEFHQNVLNNTVDQLNKQRPGWQNVAPGDTITIPISGSSLYSNYGGVKGKPNVLTRTVNPALQPETVLGSYIAKATDDAIIVEDAYNWNKADNISGIYGGIRRSMGEIGTPDSIGDNNARHIKFKYPRKKKE